MISRIINFVGRSTSWLSFLLVILIFVNVVLRYFFDHSSAWITELEWHAFALIFLLSASYTYKADQHVRVDLFYTKFSKKKKAWVNIIGDLIFLLPWCIIIFYTSFKYAHHAFVIGETSAEPEGLSFRFLIKGSIALGFLLLFLQGIDNLIKNIKLILNKD